MDNFKLLQQHLHLYDNLNKAETEKELIRLSKLLCDRNEEFDKAQRNRWLLATLGFSIFYCALLFVFGKPHGWDILRAIGIGVLFGMGHVFVNASVFVHIAAKNKIEAERLSKIKTEIAYLEERYDSLGTD